MQDRDVIIKKIQSLPDADLQEVAEYLDFLEEREDRQEAQA